MRFSHLSALFFLVAGSHQCSHTEDLGHVFAKLPATAVGPKIPESGYFYEHLGDGTYWITDGSYQSMFVVSTEGVIVVDVPPTIGKNLLYAIGNVTDKPITHLVYSHAHSDHIGAAAIVVNKHTEIIAHKDTLELLQLTPDPLRPFPTTTFRDNYDVVVGNQTLQLFYHGENHYRGNIYIYAEDPKVLMLIDVVFPGWVPFSELAVSSNIPGWIQAHDIILKYDFKHYIGGHLTRLGTKADVLVQKEYIKDLFDNCKAAIELTATADPVLGAQAILGAVGALNPGNPWSQFKGYLDVVAEYCGNKTTEKWVGKLGAADVFSFENAYAMVERLRLDYNVLGPFKNI